MVRLRDFQESSAREIRQALRELDKQAGGELGGLVLDLRNNGGGLLEQAIAVTNIFLAKGTIVRTRGRGGKLMDEAFATPAGTRRNSASTSACRFFCLTSVRSRFVRTRRTPQLMS